MNILIIIGVFLAGGTIAFDHLIHELPHWLAVVLYTAAVIMIIAGMIKSRMRELQAVQNKAKRNSLDARIQGSFLFAFVL